jgi:hypothetical protein
LGARETSRLAFLESGIRGKQKAGHGAHRRKVRNMAKAKVRQLNTPRLFNVQLTEGEVDFVLGVLGNISGDPAKSPRKYGDRILAALTKAAGYAPEATDAAKVSLGAIHFNDYGDGQPDDSVQRRLEDQILSQSVSFQRLYKRAKEVNQRALLSLMDFFGYRGVK